MAERRFILPSCNVVYRRRKVLKSAKAIDPGGFDPFARNILGRGLGMWQKSLHSLAKSGSFDQICLCCGEREYTERRGVRRTQFTACDKESKRKRRVCAAGPQHTHEKVCAKCNIRDPRRCKYARLSASRAICVTAAV
jgi:hypothetical protein